MIGFQSDVLWIFPLKVIAISAVWRLRSSLIFGWSWTHADRVSLRPALFFSFDSAKTVAVCYKYPSTRKNMVSIWPFGLTDLRPYGNIIPHENQCKMWFRINSLIIRLPVEKSFRLCQKKDNSRRITRKRRCVSFPCSDGDDHLTFERRMGQFQTDLKRKRNSCLDSLVLCLSRKIQLSCKGRIIRASWPVWHDWLAFPKAAKSVAH